jgi:hypothetical protein
MSDAELESLQTSANSRDKYQRVLFRMENDIHIILDCGALLNRVLASTDPVDEDVTNGLLRVVSLIQESADVLLAAWKEAYPPRVVPEG